MEIYTNEKLYNTNSWLQKPIKTVEEIPETLTKCQRIDISSKAPLPIHCDGESMGVADQLTLQSSQKQINVILK